jgi:hypothetical protein
VKKVTEKVTEVRVVIAVASEGCCFSDHVGVRSASHWKAGAMDKIVVDQGLLSM